VSGTGYVPKLNAVNMLLLDIFCSVIIGNKHDLFQCYVAASLAVYSDGAGITYMMA
jgi:hypothetical protein